MDAGALVSIPAVDIDRIDHEWLPERVRRARMVEAGRIGASVPGPSASLFVFPSRVFPNGLWRMEIDLAVAPRKRATFAFLST